jgi:hypothetical protein
MRLPVEGVLAAFLVLTVGGFVIAPFMADYLVAEAPVRRHMRHQAIGVVGGGAALVALAAIAFWFVLAAFVSPEGCAWLAGVGGCLPR